MRKETAPVIVDGLGIREGMDQNLGKIPVHQIKNSPGTSGPRNGPVLRDCRKQLIAL